jgi:hypothetical protein
MTVKRQTGHLQALRSGRLPSDRLRSGGHRCVRALGLAFFASLGLLPFPCSAQRSLQWVQVDQPTTSPTWKFTTLGSTPDDPESSPASQSAGERPVASKPGSQPAQPQPAQPQVASSVPLPAPPGQPFLDVGVGPRIGIGEPTYPAVSLRLGVPLSSNTSLSLRPFYVFGNSDYDGVPNSQGEFTLPLTLDLFTDSPVSAYFGPGVSWNVDSSGLVTFSLSGGLDFRIAERIRLTTGLYYDMDNDKSGFGDWMANAFLYFRL